MRSRYDAGLPEPMELKNVRRIGVFKMRNIGDVLMITPVLRALRETFPDAHITVIVNAGTEAMLAGNPHIDDVIVYRRGEGSVLGREGKFLRDLRRHRFDLTIGFTDGGRTAWCSWLSGARYRFGAAHYSWHRFDPRRWIYNHPMPSWPPRPMHEVERHFFLLEVAGLQLKSTKPGPLCLTVPDDLRRWAEEQVASLRPARVVQVHPVARWLWKCWDSGSMAAVIDWLQEERGARVIVTTGPVDRERERAREIVALCRTQPLFFDGDLSLTQLAALSSVTDGYFGVDTAPMHMAAAVGVPVLALFGPTNASSWGPWASRQRVLSAPCPCNEAQKQQCDWNAVRACLAAITPAQAQAALDELILLPA
jgi:heptosyltransferase-3